MATRFAIFLQLKALPAWLALSRADRRVIADKAFAYALKDGRVTLRHFDAEAFSAPTSDIALFETGDLAAYYFAIERLRDSPIFAHPYFDVIAIHPTIEDGYRAFETKEAAA